MVLSQLDCFIYMKDRMGRYTYVNEGIKIYLVLQ